MRSIGKKNITLVKNLTRKVLADKTFAGNVRLEVLGKLPDSLWDTWEGAHSEIERIINDTIME
jgi:hypothetical protein